MGLSLSRRVFVIAFLGSTALAVLVLFSRHALDESRLDCRPATAAGPRCVLVHDRALLTTRTELSPLRGARCRLHRHAPTRRRAAYTSVDLVLEGGAGHEETLSQVGENDGQTCLVAAAIQRYADDDAPRPRSFPLRERTFYGVFVGLAFAALLLLMIPLGLRRATLVFDPATRELQVLERTWLRTARRSVEPIDQVSVLARHGLKTSQVVLACAGDRTVFLGVERSRDGADELTAELNATLREWRRDETPS